MNESTPAFFLEGGAGYVEAFDSSFLRVAFNQDSSLLVSFCLLSDSSIYFKDLIPILLYMDELLLTLNNDFYIFYDPLRVVTSKPG